MGVENKTTGDICIAVQLPVVL